MDQLVQAVDVIMGNLPYILFRPKSETKEYVVLLFWSTNMDDAACECKKHGNYQARSSSGSVPIALCVGKRTNCKTSIPLSAQQLHLFKMQKDDVCHLPPDNHEQLETFVKLLTNPEPTKKRKVDIIASTP